MDGVTRNVVIAHSTRTVNKYTGGHRKERTLKKTQNRKQPHKIIVSGSDKIYALAIISQHKQKGLFFSPNYLANS